MASGYTMTTAATDIEVNFTFTILVVCFRMRACIEVLVSSHDFAILSNALPVPAACLPVFPGLATVL